MFGYTIKYKGHTQRDRTLLNHTLFGRIMQVPSRTKQYGYYIAGMLHNTKFCRIGRSYLFIENMDNIDIDELEIFGSIDITEYNGEIDETKLKTGREYWKEIGDTKNITIKDKRRQNGYRKKR